MVENRKKRLKNIKEREVLEDLDVDVDGRVL
jgi:hypothetical protein